MRPLPRRSRLPRAAALAHPRWEFVFQPKYAAYLNLIEPWWKVLCALALKGRRFVTWEEVCRAVAAATAYWNGHRHPFVWGHRRGIAHDANPALLSHLPSHSLTGWTT